MSDNDFLNDGIIPAKQAIVNLLNKFLKSRPGREDLVQNRVLKSDFKSIPLRYSLIDILCSRLEKSALSIEGIFRISGSAQQIRLFWTSFTSDQIEFPQNDHTVAGALKLYIREQNEPLIPYELFSSYIANSGNSEDGISVQELQHLLSRINPENLRIIKRIFRLLITLVRHNNLNKMHASNMGIVFGPNIFKSKPDSMNVIFESKYGNEAVTTIINNHLIVFPDLEVPLLGTETNTINGQGEDQLSQQSGQETQSASTPNSISNGNTPQSPHSSASPLLISTQPNSIQNSKSLSRTQLQPIHPSLLFDTQSEKEQITTQSPLVSMKRSDLSMFSHLSKKLHKSKHFKKEEGWDYFLLQRVTGNLVVAQKSLVTGTITTVDPKTKKSSSTTQINQTAASAAIKLVPIYMFISAQNIFFFDTQNYEIQWILPHNRLRDICIDIVNKGLFSILEAETHKLTWFLASKPKTIDLMVRALERGRSIAKLSNKGLAHLQARRFALLESGSNQQSSFAKLPESRPVFESLAESGFTELDVWEGTVDLLEVVKKFRNILVPTEPKAVVEFLLPTIDEFKGIYRKSYKLDINTSVFKIISLICEKVKLEPSKFLLRTLKGRTLFDNATLNDYGLGTLFTTWQLRLISLNSPENTGNFVVEFWFPNSPEFKGMQKKALKVDAYQPLKRLMKDLCDRLKVPRYHYYQLIGPEGEVLSDNDNLSSIGLGIKFKTFKMKIVKKQFPIGTNPEKDQLIVKSLIDDLVEAAWKKIRDRHQERIRIYCKHMLEYILDQTFVEISKAELVPKRVSQLGKNSRADFYHMLATKEDEELIIMDMNGYRKTLIKARTVVYDDPEPSANYPLFKAKTTTGGGGPMMHTSGAQGLRNIKIANANNPFMNELRDYKTRVHGVNNKSGAQSETLSATKIKSSSLALRSQKQQQYKYVSNVNNPNTIVSLLSLKPGTSKLVEQLKNRMDVSFNKVDQSMIEDLVPSPSPQRR
ncbi:RhoGAP domain-containing protein [Tieghemostelium lacteum]|uniref:RhoGAP domain-containing protein n=1 Tax=Tieghemostelium lacteum TaxID=361077 RepID=A0A151ZDJ7_TIELA|nr:RhoGAP domain-containing protein [Tieghemostelium lacteum]|eukprot:KYQ91999.1 RhoGAP domain-containing protein [Tieghemostelium lacteum]